MSDRRAGEIKKQKKRDEQEREEKFKRRKNKFKTLRKDLLGICTICSEKLKKCKKPSKLEDADEAIKAILSIAKEAESKIKASIQNSRADNTLDQVKNYGHPSHYKEAEQKSRQPQTSEAQEHLQGGTVHKVTDDKDEETNQTNRVDNSSDQVKNYILSKDGLRSRQPETLEAQVPYKVTEDKDEVSDQTNRIQDHKSKKNSGDCVLSDNRQGFESEKSLPLPDYPTEDIPDERNKKYPKADAKLTDEPTGDVNIANMKREVEKLRRGNKELLEEREDRMKEINRLKTELERKDEFSFRDSKIDSKSRTPDLEKMTVDVEKQSRGMESGVGMLNKGNHDEEYHTKKKATGGKEDQKMWGDTLCEPDSEIPKYQQQIDELTADLRKAKSLAKNREQSLQEREAELQNEQQSKSTLKSQVKKLEFEKNEALTRLSELAGRRLLDNNPSIADLSTEIRPTKIGENFKQLYDNEWTEAFEELTEEGKAEDDCIKILLEIVKGTFKFAKEEAENFESKMIRTVTTFPENANKEQHIKSTKDEGELIKQLKRVSAARTSAAVQDMYIRKIKKETAFGERCKSYVVKCVELCWYMAVQSPPMVIFCDGEKWQPFDEKYYARYTATGNLINFVVWPCTLLHEKGPVLSKGVAQATKEKLKKQAPATPNESNSSTKPKYESHSHQKKEVHQTAETQRNFSRTERSQGSNKQLSSDRGTKSVYGTPFTNPDILKRDPSKSRSFKEKATPSETRAHVTKLNVTKM